MGSIPQATSLAHLKMATVCTASYAHIEWLGARKVSESATWVSGAAPTVHKFFGMAGGGPTGWCCEIDFTQVTGLEFVTCVKAVIARYKRKPPIQWAALLLQARLNVRTFGLRRLLSLPSW
jgi:hypothetical protein